MRVVASLAKEKRRHQAPDTFFRSNQAEPGFDAHLCIRSIKVSQPAVRSVLLLITRQKPAGQESFQGLKFDAKMPLIWAGLQRYYR